MPTVTTQFPSYYDASQVGSLFAPKVATAADSGQRAKLRPSSRDQERIALVLIDAQIDFIHPSPVGTLTVPGAIEDTRRTVEFIYRNAERISTIVASLDSHLTYQIFYPTWWINAQGEHPDPFTLIGPDDLQTGRWRPVLEPSWSLDYVSKLANSDKKALCVWPYHTMVGAVGYALDPSLFEAITYHAAARRSQPIFLSKGSIPQTEHYSVLEPEVKYPKHPQGGLNTALLDTLAQHDVVYVAGQAKSHCVLESLRSMLSYFDKEPDVIAKIRVLMDCTSSVVHPDIDFEAMAAKEFAHFEQRGVQLLTSQDPISLFHQFVALSISLTSQ
jgi:nicotinamidase/pyrazinamidase